MTTLEPIQKIRLLKRKSVLSADYSLTPLVRPAEQELERKLNQLIERVNLLSQEKGEIE